MARSSTATRPDPSGVGIRRVRDSEAEARRRVAETRIECERALADARQQARDIEARARRRIQRIQRVAQKQLDEAPTPSGTRAGDDPCPQPPDPHRQRLAARRLADLLIGLEPDREDGS